MLLSFGSNFENKHFSILDLNNEQCPEKN